MLYETNDGTIFDTKEIRIVRPVWYREQYGTTTQYYFKIGLKNGEIVEIEGKHERCPDDEEKVKEEREKIIKIWKKGQGIK